MSRSKRLDLLIPILPLGALMVFAAVAGTMSLRAYDLFWHLATGRWILEHRALPEIDPFRFTSAGAPWVDHEWLFQVVQRTVEIVGGLDALVVTRTLVVMGLAGVLFAALRASGTTAAGAALIAAVAIFGARPRMMMRPELASLVALPLLLTLLQSYRRRRGWLSIAGAVAVVVVWANVHGAVLIAPVVAGAYLIGSRLPGGSGPGRGGDSAVPWASIALVPLALAGALLVNPYGVDIYRVPFRIAQALEGIPALNPEWLPAWAAPQPGLIVGAAALAALLAFAGFRTGRIDPATGLSTLALAALAISGVRHQGLFFLGAAFFAGEALADLSRHDARAPGISFDKRGVLPASLFCLLAATWCLFPPPSGPLRARQGPYSFGLGLEPGRFPVEAAERIAERPDLGPLYNDVAFGGYLTWRLYPEKQVFIDGRNEIRPDLLREVSLARSDSRRWSQLLAHHEIDAALVRYDDRLREVVAPTPADGTRPKVVYHTTNALLFPRNRFALVYWDDVAMLFVRRTEDRTDWLARDEYGFVHPEDRRATLDRAAVDPDFLRGVLTEIERRLGENPPCDRAVALREEIHLLKRGHAAATSGGS